MAWWNKDKSKKLTLFYTETIYQKQCEIKNFKQKPREVAALELCYKKC